MVDWSLLIDLGNTRSKWVWAPDGKIDESTLGHGNREELEQEKFISYGGGSLGRDKI